MEQNGLPISFVIWGCGAMFLLEFSSGGVKTADRKVGCYMWNWFFFWVFSIRFRQTPYRKDRWRGSVVGLVSPGSEESCILQLLRGWLLRQG
jgi:hypothetical protein